MAKAPPSSLIISSNSKHNEFFIYQTGFDSPGNILRAIPSLDEEEEGDEIDCEVIPFYSTIVPGFDADRDIKAIQTSYKSKDGTSIPMFILMPMRYYEKNRREIDKGEGVGEGNQLKTILFGF